MDSGQQPRQLRDKVGSLCRHSDSTAACTASCAVHHLLCIPDGFCCTFEAPHLRLQGGDRPEAINQCQGHLKPDDDCQWNQQIDGLLQARLAPLRLREPIPISSMKTV